MNLHLIDSGLVSLWSRKASSATANFQPLTEELNSTFVKEARFARWIEAATPKFLAAFGYQTSHDGTDWDTTPTTVGAYSATAGWTYSDGAVSAVTTDPRLFIRFGICSANDTGSTDVEQAMGRLRVQIKPVEGATLGHEGVKVFSNGGTTDGSRIFHPILGPTPMEAIGEARATLRLTFSSGLLQVKPAYQVSNDALTWNDGESGAADTFTTFGSARSVAGIDFGTTFTTFNPTEKKRLVRWGVAVNNTSGSLNEAGLVGLRLDYRRVT